MLNKIMLQGRFVADPELRHTPNGVATASFRLAVDRDFKDRETGEKKADFINVVTWRQTAEFTARFFNKGKAALVDGRLQLRDYTDRDGNKRTIAEVVADNVYFDGGKKDGDGGNYSAPAAASPYTPTGTGYTATPDVEQFTELSDDGELPF